MLEIYKFTAMTSPCELQLYCNDKTKADSCAKDILTQCKRLEHKYNYYAYDSYLNSINNRDNNILDNETKELLKRAKQYYNKTNGIFDITLCTYKSANQCNSINEYLQKKEELKPFVGCEHFTIKKDKIYFDNIITKLDLGGFVKEYSVDMALKIIKKYKINSALINFGGDIYAHGLKPNKEKFSISITNPLNKNTKLFSIKIQDEALTTSASYERNYTLENKTYSHIHNIKENRDILSATVISKTCVNSGVYSTALMCEDIKCIYDKYLINEKLEVIR